MSTIAFFGLPLAALLLDSDGHRIALASISRADAPGRRRLCHKIGADRVLLRPDVEDPAFVERLRQSEIDLVVSWFWTTRLPSQVIASARWGGINAHPSLLPRHRGPDPTYWAIASGDLVTGVTIHRLADDYDTGPILATESLAIEPELDALALARALDRPSLRLIRSVVDRIARGEVVPELPQDERLATQAPLLADEEAGIRWTWPTERILRHIRALAPAPGAFTEIDGAVVTVLRAAAAGELPFPLAPGEAASYADQPVVGTADGAIILLRVEVDGEPTGLRALCSLIERAALASTDPRAS